MNASLSPIVTKSNLMTAYNLARQAKVFEPKRLNRALGIVQHHATQLLPDGRLDVNINDWHMATIKDCDCIDHKHNKYCKHVIAAMLVTKAQRLAQEIKQ
jgi:hypothetical protein